MESRSMNRKPKPVTFPSADGKTVLIGYLWRPASGNPGPAVVMLHGRSGVYSTSATTFHSRTLSKRHLMWGDFWAERGYVALLADSFGPRGHVRGFLAGSIGNRPREVSEKDVRPLDAYGALAWLRSQADLCAGPIALHGWSNGAMAALWAMSERMLKQVRLSASDGFCAALAFYPGCSRLVQEQPDYRPYAPILMLLAGQDEEVNPRTCETFGQQVHVNSNGSQFQLYTYPGAEHSFDHPDKAGHHNAFARDDAKRRAATFMEQYVRRAYSSSVSPSD